jgi:probable rRNA maturation factor
MANIRFNSQNIKFKLPYPKKTSQWLTAICAQENKQLGSLTYIFCSDAYLLSLNKKFLGHATFTDILSFDLTEDKNLIVGEIYISIPRVTENAKAYVQPFLTELRRVMAHGLLHFVGYRDKTPAQRAQMRKKEEACLSLWQ